MKSVFLLICIIIYAILICGCNNDQQKETVGEQQDGVSSLTYSKFVQNIYKIQESNFKNFTLLSQKEGIEQATIAMPETKLDSRATDELNDGEPSKYIFEFMNKDKDVYIRTSFIYYSMSDDGILLQSIISPDTEFARKED